MRGSRVSRTAGHAGQGTGGKHVRVSAPTRLHFGLLPVAAGNFGRFGGLGAALRTPRVVVEVVPADRLLVSGYCRDRAEQFVRKALCGILGWDDAPVAVTIVQAPPAHVGLGSGTQLALATACALAIACQRSFDVQQAASILGRARRSAIGLGAFLHGGFLVDRGQLSQPAAERLCRIDWPSEWRFVVMLPEPTAVMCGQEEEAIFSSPEAIAKDDRLPGEMARAAARVADALSRRDFERFSIALQRYGELAGVCFARFQGGIFAHPQAQDIARFIRARWGLAVVQSSWGPVLAAPVDTAARARQLRAEVLKAFGGVLSRVWVTGVARRGARIQRLELSPVSRYVATAAGEG